MTDNLFQNDRITGNSLIGFEFRGQFEDDENVILEKLKNILNRSVTYSNIEYKVLEPTGDNAVLMKDDLFYECKTPQYSYFEAMFIMPRLLEFLKTLKETGNSYVYFRIGFHEEFCDIKQMNIMKFILEFNEQYILNHITDATKDGSLEKLTDIKPQSLEASSESVIKQYNILKFNDEEIYGIAFNNLQKGYITFRYAQEINYRNKWEEILKSLNHTIITLYNSSINQNLTDEERKKIEKIDDEVTETSKSFTCFETFREKYKGIKLTKDLDNDSAAIDVIFPSIKDKLFDIVVRNGIRSAKINYDSDISKLQLKDIELKKCYHISGVDIVESELENCSISDCDIYDTKINNSTITKCNLFGYANCKESKFKDCFVSRNIQLTDCTVYGQLGKMGGIMKGGLLKNTAIITSMAELSADVKKQNVNEIQ